MVEVNKIRDFAIHTNQANNFKMRLAVLIEAGVCRHVQPAFRRHSAAIFLCQSRAQVLVNNGRS